MMKLDDSKTMENTGNMLFFRPVQDMAQAQNHVFHHELVVLGYCNFLPCIDGCYIAEHV